MADRKDPAGGAEDTGFTGPDEAAQDLTDALEQVVPPSHYIADVDLFIGGEGAMPARAFNAGDHILPQDVERFGWQDRVHRPADEPAPAPPKVAAKDTAKSPPAGRKQEE